MASSDAQAKLQEGQKHFFSDPPNYPQAIALLREATDLAPGWSEGFVWLGSALLEGSRFSEAEPIIRKAIALDPKDSRPHIYLGMGFERAGKFGIAARCYRDGLTLKPHYGEADARLMLAGVLKKSGHIKEAILEWQIVEKMEPMYPSYKGPMEDAKSELENHKR